MIGPDDRDWWSNASVHRFTGPSLLCRAYDPPPIVGLPTVDPDVVDPVVKTGIVANLTPCPSMRSGSSP